MTNGLRRVKSRHIFPCIRKTKLNKKKHQKFLISVELQSQINNKYFRTLNLFINKNNKLNDFNIKEIIDKSFKNFHENSMGG